MEQWKIFSLMICIFGVIKEFRPSEPYITKYLTHQPMNFTTEEVNSKIYPVGTYSSLGLLVFVFLFTDLLRYKVILIINGLSGVALYSLLLGCRKLFWMQVVEVLYGLFSACDVAYYTYVYNKVPRSVYLKVSSHTRGAYLIGRAISGITSQLLISYTDLSYFHLNFFTLSGMVLATLWACFLPKVDKSLYFHRRKSENIIVDSCQVNEEEEVNCCGIFNRGLHYMWNDFTVSFTSSYLVKWAAWWALATAGYLQVLNYIQSLWEEITYESGGHHSTNNLNGAVEASYTLLSAAASLVSGHLEVNWSKWGEPVMSGMSLLIAVILLSAAETNIIYVAYVADVLFKIVYNAIITIANAEVAKNITSDSYALIFGVTTFVALGIQSLITLFTNTTLKLSSRDQFRVYSGYFAALGIIFLLFSLLSFKSSKSINVYKNSEKSASMLGIIAV